MWGCSFFLFLSTRIVVRSLITRVLNDLIIILRDSTSWLLHCYNVLVMSNVAWDVILDFSLIFRRIYNKSNEVDLTWLDNLWILDANLIHHHCLIKWHKRLLSAYWPIRCRNFLKLVGRSARLPKTRKRCLVRSSAHTIINSDCRNHDDLFDLRLWRAAFLSGRKLSLNCLLVRRLLLIPD